MEKRKSTGEIYVDLMSKEVPDVYEAQEINDERQKKYASFVLSAVQEGKKTLPYNNDFIIEVQFKKEALTPNVDQFKIFARRTCPLPHFDQTVYRYHRATDSLELLWSLPDAVSCMNYRAYPLDIASDETECRDTALSYFDGTLMNKQADVNSELFRKEVDDTRRII